MRFRSRSEPGGSPFRLKPLALGVAACFAISSAFALPTAPTVVSGSASFAQSGNVLTIKNSPSAIINWQSFSIGQSEATKFIQNSASSAVLNRITGQDPSAILGTLQSNGRVFLINPNGIVFGQGSRIDVAGLVASTLNLRDEDFLGGKLAFTAGASAGTLTNQGAITTPGGGHVYLIAPDVQNSGVITSPKGEVLLAAGRSVQLVDVGTPDLRVEISAPGTQAVNLGEIAAEAGRIGIAGALVRNSGTLNASSAVEEGGRVFLRASQDTYVDGAGRIVATGTKGGRVEVLGERVAVMDNASIDVSGTGSANGGGGTILVGGGYQGKDADVPNAKITYFGPNATLKANAENVGDGGTAIVWADDTTRAFGTIEARGGAQGGDGGFVETSGKRWLDANGARVSTGAPRGRAGTWLLDPTDISIIHDTYGGADIDITPTTPFEGTSSTATLSDYTINLALTDGNVTVTTSSSYGGSGDILFNQDVVLSNTSSPRLLSLQAERNIVLRGTINNYASTGGLTVELDAAGGISTPSGSTLSLYGDLSPVVVQVNGGKAWGNDGLLHLTGNSQIRLHDGTTPATLNNSGTLWLQSNNPFPIFSNGPSQQNGVLNNYGTMKVTTSASIEAQFNQLATGTTVVGYGGTVTLSLQNLGTLAGTVDFQDSGSYLWVSENHGSAMKFEQTNFTAGIEILPQVKIGGSASPVPVTFQGVTGAPPSVVVDSYGGLALTGFNKLYSLSFADSLYGGIPGRLAAVNNGTLGVVGGFAIPGGVSYSGNVGYFATGSLTANSGGLSAGSANLTLVSGWDGANSAGNVTDFGDLALAGTISGGAVTLRAGGAITTGQAHSINGSSVTMAANGMFGADIGNSGNPVTTQTAQLTAMSSGLYGGSVWVDNTGNLQLAGANAAQSIFAVRSTGSISLMGTLAANTVLMKSGSFLDLGGGMTAVSFSGVSGSYLKAFNNGSLNLTYGGLWTGSSQYVSAGGVDPANGEAIAIKAGGGHLGLNGGVSAAGGEVFFGGNSIGIGQTATAAITGATELGFAADGLSFGFYGGVVPTLSSLHFGTATAGRAIALYSGTAPSCVAGNSCLAIDLAKVGTTFNGVSRIGFGNDGSMGAFAPPSGDITLYTGLTSASLPPGATDVGLLTGGAVVQNGQAINVPKLGVSSSGDIVLTTSVDTFAAKTGGGLTLTNSKALTLGGVGDLTDPAESIVGVKTAGPMAITAAGTLTNAGGISSTGASITLTTTAGDIANNAPGISSYGGNVTVTAAGGIGTALIDAGAGNVRLTSYGGGIADLDGAAPNISANALFIDVTTASDFGTAVASLAGNTHGSNLRIAQSGSLVLSGLDLGSGNLDLAVNGGTLSGSGTGAALSGNAIMLAASSIDLNTNVAAVSATAADFISITSGRSLSFAGTAGGDVTVQTTAPPAGASDITLGLVKAVGKKVTLDAAGAIIDGNDTSAPALNIEAAALDLKSTAGIGVGNPLETKASGITILNGDGNVEIYNQGLLTLGPVTLEGKGDFFLDNIGKVETKAPTNVYGGSATIQAHSPIIIGAALTASGDIVLLTTDDGTTGDTITINGPLKSGGNITVSANDTIFQNANVTSTGAGAISFTSTSGGIVMKGGTIVSSLGGTISFDAAGNIVLSQLTTGSTGSVSVKTSGGTIGSSITGNNITTALMVLSAKSGISNIYFDAQYADVTTEAGIVTIINSVTGDVFSNDPALAVTDPVKQALEQQLSSSTLAATDSLIPDAGDTTVALLGGGQGGSGNGDDEDEDKKKGGGKSDEGKKDETLKPSRLPVCR